MNERRSIGVTIFGWIFLVLGLLVILGVIYILCFKLRNILLQVKFMSSLPSTIGLSMPGGVSYEKIIYIFVFLLSIMTFFGLIYFICGIGILRVKAWARYFIITLMMTYIIGLPYKGLFFGWQSLGSREVLIFAIPSFVIWFFKREKTKRQFRTQEVKFKLKSGYGIILCLVVLLIFLPPPALLTFKLYSSLKYKEPFFNLKPKIVKLEKIDESSLLDKYRRIELFDASILIPKEFVIFRLGRGSCDIGSVRTDTDIIDGAVLLDRGNIYEMMKEGLFKIMRFKDAFECEKAFHTNNWSPIIMWQRKIFTPQIGIRNFQLEEVDTPTFKGFIRSGFDKRDGRWLYLCSFYSKDSQFSKQMTIMSNNKKLITNIISSFNFLKQQKKDAEQYYKEGKEALDAGDFITAQFKFANAHYLSPENPEYGYLLAKALYKNGRGSLWSIKIILTEILKLKSDFEEAKNLLKIVESELPKKKE